MSFVSDWYRNYTQEAQGNWGWLGPIYSGTFATVKTVADNAADELASAVYGPKSQYKAAKPAAPLAPTAPQTAAGMTVYDPAAHLAAQRTQHTDAWRNPLAIPHSEPSGPLAIFAPDGNRAGPGNNVGLWIAAALAGAATLVFIRQR